MSFFYVPLALFVVESWKSLFPRSVCYRLQTCQCAPYIHLVSCLCLGIDSTFVGCSRNPSYLTLAYDLQLCMSLEHREVVKGQSVLYFIVTLVNTVWGRSIYVCMHVCCGSLGLLFLLQWADMWDRAVLTHNCPSSLALSLWCVCVCVCVILDG